MSQATKIPPQHAANVAAQYLKELVPIDGVPTVEEVEFSEEANEWHITLGYKPADPSNHFAYAFGQRDYKSFRVNADTGEVLSMKIRKIS